MLLRLYSWSMFAYVDYSGNLGFKFNYGSSRYVVLAACIFES